ncbi:MAG: hypothetical protein ACI9VS_001054 [Candidatus Binatia bacterium]|jgi:hypothetical protein
MDIKRRADRFLDELLWYVDRLSDPSPPSNGVPVNSGHKPE